MGKRKDLTNIRFNNLIVLKESGKDNFGRLKWECLCENCHREFHFLYGLNTTKQDFLDWID